MYELIRVEARRHVDRHSKFSKLTLIKNKFDNFCEATRSYDESHRREWQAFRLLTGTGRVGVLRHAPVGPAASSRSARGSRAVVCC